MTGHFKPSENDISGAKCKNHCEKINSSAKVGVDIEIEISLKGCIYSAVSHRGFCKCNSGRADDAAQKTPDLNQTNQKL